MNDWTVIPVKGGEAGTIGRLRLKLPVAEFAVHMKSTRMTAREFRERVGDHEACIIGWTDDVG